MPRIALAWNPDFAHSSPLFEPLRAAASFLHGQSTWPGRAHLQLLLREGASPVTTSTGLPLTLVPAPLANDTQLAYERRALERGELQVREESWHDLLNVLVWHTWPRAKAALNARHCAAVPATGARPAGRTATGDALTLFDESGVIVACRDPTLLALLRGHRWKSLFWQHRAQLARDMRFVVFGHGLYEQALAPFIGLTGKALLLETDATMLAAPFAAQLAQLDARIAAVLADPGRFLGTRELCPLPLLGVPGWSADNADERYYDDRDYFRPARFRPEPRSMR